MDQIADFAKNDQCQGFCVA